MMENKSSSSSRKSKIMVLCKKHPKHRQTPGVCSICLREKLTKLPSTSSSTSRATTVTVANASSTCSSSSLSSLSSECSSNASSYSSPMHHHHRGLEQGKGNLLSFLKMMMTIKNNDNKIDVMLRKSRSMAFVEDGERISMDNHRRIIKNKASEGQGFWSKLIRSKTSNKRRIIAEGGLMHSRTMRDMLTTRV